MKLAGHGRPDSNLPLTIVSQTGPINLTRRLATCLLPVDPELVCTTSLPVIRLVREKKLPGSQHCLSCESSPITRHRCSIQNAAQGADLRHHTGMHICRTTDLRGQCCALDPPAELRGTAGSFCRSASRPAQRGWTEMTGEPALASYPVGRRTARLTTPPSPA